MTDSLVRVPPADPDKITLSYLHRHLWWFDADTAPETWHVSADVYDDSGADVVEHVASMDIVAVDVYDTRDPFGLFDGEDADLGLIAEVVFSARTGRLDPELEGMLEAIGSRVLILGSVRLAPR